MAMNNPFEDGPAPQKAPVKKGGIATVGSDGEQNTITDLFANPGGGGGDQRIQDFLGELLLVNATEYIPEMTTRIGTGDAVRVDVIRLEADNEQVGDLLVFQEALKRELRKLMRNPSASWLLGRLEMGAEKNGKSAPYILTEATDAEKAHAQKVMRQLGLG